MRRSTVGVCLYVSVMGMSRAQLPQATPAVEKKPFHAFCWQLDELNRSVPWRSSPYPNITQFYWLTQTDLETGSIPAAAVRLKTAMDLLPPGRRAVFDWDNSRLFWSHPRDQMQDTTGARFTGPWWDHGVRQVSERFDAFFKHYREIGGQLDVFVLDMEHAVGGGGVGGDQDDVSLHTKERVDALVSNPRFQEIMKRLKIDDPSYFHDREFYPNMKWMAYARDTTRRNINQGMYEPVRRYFPKVTFSNYGDFCDKHGTPWPNGPLPDPGEGIPGRHGGYAGTHQATDGLYGGLGGITREWAQPVEGQKVTATPFNACLLHTNLMRTAVLSDPAPVTPWIAWRRYDGHGFMPPGQMPMANTDYFQELLFHVALCSPDYFIFWSAFRWQKDAKAEDYCTTADCQFVNDLLDEINGLLGYADRRTLVDKLAPWHDGYLLSGMYANGQNVWRLTLDANKVQDLAACVVTQAPPTFAVLGARLETPSVPLNVRVTATTNLRDGVVRQRVVYDLAPGETVAAWLLFRGDLAADAPGVLAIHQHGGEDNFAIGKDGCCQDKPDDPTQYAYHAALAGFRVLAPDALCFGERAAEWGYSQKFFAEILEHARLCGEGRSLAWKSVWDNSRAIEVLEAQGCRAIGAIGLSGGSTQAYILTAVNPKVRAAACFFSFVTLRHQFYQYKLCHCLYHYVPGMVAEGVDWDQVVALAAPRKLFLAWGGKDEGTPEPMYRAFVEAIEARCLRERLPPSVVTFEDRAVGHQITRPMLDAAVRFLQDSVR